MSRPSFLRNQTLFSRVFGVVKAQGATILVFVATLSLAAGTCASPYGSDMAEGFPSPDSLEDYLWMKYYRLRKGRSWMRVTRAGHALYVELGAPGTKQIDAVRAGTLSTPRTEQLFDHLQRIEFFHLGDAIPSGVVEADILNVAARLDGQRHQVSARPPTAVPEGLMGLVDSLESIVPSLDSVAGDRLLLRAQTLSSDRVQELRDSGAPQLPFEDVPQHSSLRLAVRHPGQFFLLGKEETSALREKVKGAPYFLVSTDDKTVAIDLYSLARSD